MDKETTENNALAYQIELLTAEVNRLAREIEGFRKALPIPETMTASDIITKLGVSQSTFYKKWNMPNFGNPDAGNSPRRWLRTTFEKWYSRPEADRRAEWEGMSADEKATYR